ncbi:MAG TPA: cytochrome c oxidase assembly protein [Baekduia sp.]|nr:cytochrome c oxidase assembly protein [Baekduia sp.]
MIATAADTSWSWAPGPLVAIACLLVVYVLRFRNARRESRNGRGAEYWRLGSWLLGLSAMTVALVSPVDTLAEQVFIMHMTQHVLLLDIAPIFLILGLSKVIMRPAARTILDLERGLGPIAHPAFAVVAYVAMMWIWHIPWMYDAALEHAWVHVLEHVAFMSVGWLYWWHLLSPVRSHVMTGMTPVAYMIATKIGVGVLGVLIPFSRKPLYSFYENQGNVWGLSPLDDQATAGAIMALEQSVVMGIALAFLFVRALNESERQSQREDAEADRLEAERAASDQPRSAVPPGI